MILSYILHGHIPCYDSSSPHPDDFLHEKLIRAGRDLLNLDIDILTEHFSASRFSYSTQALPVNVLLDTLIRPLGETEDALRKTCVAWKYASSQAVPHVVVGHTNNAGGQWVDNPVAASWDIGTLSYAGMISLPGYGFDEHYERQHGRPMPIFLRPSRRDVADYLAAYPDQVGISDSIYNGEHISGIARQGDGFFISSHGLYCKNLVLASGIFSELIAPRPLLRPLVSLSNDQTGGLPHPLLVVGSGFSAADIIISTSVEQKILHIYKWAPSTSPSPLRGCHQDAYPEYAGVYRHMKLAALSSTRSRDKRPRLGRNASEFDSRRDWRSTYEGMPNTEILDVQLDEDQTSATVTLKRAGRDEMPFQRHVSGLAYVVGRRGSLDYLSSELFTEVLPGSGDACGCTSRTMISAQTLREKANGDLEVAPHVFITGSLVGDSLVRFAYGGCAYAAGRIMQYSTRDAKSTSTTSNDKTNGVIKACWSRFQTPTSSPRIPAMIGFDGHEASPVSLV